MASFDEFLRENLPIADALDAPPVVPPERIRKRFEEALARTFGRAKILAASEMRLVILGILKQGTVTGSEIIDRLEGLHVELETKGDGAIFGLLHQMEDGNLVETRFEESTALTRYQITDAGEGMLQRDGSSAFDGLGLSALLSPQ